MVSCDFSDDVASYMNNNFCYKIFGSFLNSLNATFSFTSNKIKVTYFAVFSLLRFRKRFVDQNFGTNDVMINVYRQNKCNDN